MNDFVTIDTKMHGLDGITGAFLVTGEQTALIETGPRSTVDNVLAGLEDAGIGSLDWIVVTHIHLDHAGAAGTLARHFPEALVAVHEVGAPHLVDPSKLWKSASRIYGDRMEEMWGGIDPLDEGRIRTLRDGDKVDLGGRTLQALETPGHAWHHHAFLDDATGVMFTGDALGVRLAGIGLVRPATPPPEFDLERAVASINRIREVAPERLCLTHFGRQDDLGVDELCSRASEELLRWNEWVLDARKQTSDVDETTRLVAAAARADAESELKPEQVERLENTTSYWMNTSGYMRYHDKRDAAG